MKLSPKAATEAAQIGRLLASTAKSATQTADPHRREAGEWWAAQLKKLQRRFRQEER